jgi:importin subunit alpha-1
MVPRLIQFMQDSSEPHLQLEAAWALTNVASGTTHQTQTIIDKGGINCFIGLLRSNRMILAEQVIPF